jgi:tetratricopeptide (TPR) repeat protein
MSSDFVIETPLLMPEAENSLDLARRLNREAEGMIGANPSLAKQYTVQAEQIAREHNAEAVLAISLLVRARLLYAELHFEEALKMCKEAVAIAANDGDIVARASTLTGLGAMWASLGLGAEALPHLEAAAALLADSPDDANNAFTRSLVGGVLAQLGHADAGKRLLTRALDVFVALGIQGRVIETRHNLACLHNHEKQFSEALTLSIQNAKDAIDASEISLYAHIEATATEALCGLSRYDEAVMRARAALSRIRVGSRGMLDVMLWLGIALDRAGRTDKALAILSDTLQKSHEAHLPPDRALLAALSSLYKRMGNLAEAEEFSRVLASDQAAAEARMTQMRLQLLETTVERPTKQ